MRWVTETFVKSHNMKLFLVLQKSKTVREAAKTAGLSYAQSMRLIRVWRTKGLIVRQGTLHGMKYLPTQEGLKVYMTVEDFMNDLQRDSDVWAK